MENFKIEGPYSMNWETGKFEKMQVTGELVRGQKIYAEGDYCNSQVFVVVNPETREIVEVGKPEEISDDWDLDNYFSPISHYDKYIRPYSKKFGIGLYYAENEPLYSEEVIKESLARAEKINLMREERQKREEEKSARNKKTLKKKYSFLTVLDKYDYKAAVKNLRTLLAHEFPGVKFSVKKAYKIGDSVDVTYIDGPTSGRVSELAGLFEGERFNGYEDMTEDVVTDFNTLFGALGYVYVKREYSEEVKNEIRKQVAEDYPILEDGKADIFRDEFYKYGLKSEKDMGINWYNLESVTMSRLHDTDFFKIDEKKKEPAKTEETEKVEIKVNTNGVQVIDYSEKAIAVIGDTKPIKDKLKELGGRFNARLSCGAGWIFSKSKENDVKALLSL